MKGHKLPLKTALRLGLSVKNPVRFFFTVLLATVAFTLTGLALIAGYYDEERAKVQTYAQFTDVFLLYGVEGEIPFTELKNISAELHLPYGAISSVGYVGFPDLTENRNIFAYARENNVHVEAAMEKIAYYPAELMAAQGISLLAGKSATTDDEILIPSCFAHFLIAYGLGEDFESLVGQSLTIFITGEEAAVTIAGVYNNAECHNGVNSTEACRSSLSYVGCLFVSETLFSRFAECADIGCFAGDHSAVTAERVIGFLEGNGELYFSDIFLPIFEYREEIASISHGLGIAGGVLAGFSVLMLFQFITISIDVKRQMIGILRALGGRSSDVVNIFMIESGFLGLLTAILALALMAGLIPVVNIIFSSVFKVRFAIMTYHALSFVLVFLVSVAASLLSALIPVVREARRLPVEVIKFNEE